MTLRTLSPAEYAGVLIAGRSAPEILYVIAKHIEAECRAFSDVADGISHYHAKLLHAVVANEKTDECREALKEIEPDSDSVDDLIAALRQLVIDQHSHLQRIEEMKRVAAVELDIPARRLCDYVFQYSPAIQRDRVRKYLYNWTEMRSSGVSLTANQAVERFRGLVRQNEGS